MGYHREMRVGQHAALGGLYLAQGISYGFVGWILLPTLAASGVSLTEQAGILAAGGIPWVFKGIWGFAFDRAPGAPWSQPRVVAMLAQLAMALSFSVLALLDDATAQPRWLVLAWFGHNVALTLQDVATDTLALDTLAEHERGRANAIMLGSHHLGMEGLAALGLGTVVAVWDLSTALWVAAVFLAVLAPLSLTLGRRARPAKTSSGWLLRLKQAFSSQGARRAALLAVVILLADNVTATASAQFLIDRLDWSVEEVQARLPWLVLFAYVLGYGFAAALVDRIGHVSAVVIGCTGLGLTWAGFAWGESMWGEPRFVQAMIFVQVGVTALLMAGLHAFLMDRTDPAVRATQFVLFMGLLNLARWIGPAVTPSLFRMLGYDGLFLVSGVFQLAVVPLVLWAGARSDAGPTRPPALC